MRASVPFLPRVVRSNRAASLAAGALCLLVGLGSAAPASATDTSFSPQFKPSLEVDRAAGPIRVDGDLNDPGWRRATRATGFAEVSPGDQVRPPVDSEAWVTYDDENLYVALVAHDDPDEVRVSVCDRDNIFRDDYFGVMLDTYGDNSWGYELFVNPLGIQGDLQMQSDGSEDIAFDLVWESQGQVTEKGYQVEIAIPFASLRFPDQSEQTWNVNFWRDHQRDVRRRYAWAARDRDDACFMCQWGTLTGIRNITPGKNVELITNVFGKQSGELADRDDPGTGFEDGDPEGEASLNFRYGLSSTASAELAINPDFSQIESDAGQIDVNQTFALFYPERRPFFQEGSDLYNTWINSVYTRSINAPDVAAKAIGEFGGFRAAYTYAHDDRTPVIVPFSQRSELLELEGSHSHILRVKRSLGNGSHVGGVFTDRRLEGEAGGVGTAGGFDGLVRITRSLQLEMQAMASHTEEPSDTTLSEDFDVDRFHDGKHTAAFDGESYVGHGLYASVERFGRYWNADFDYWEYSPTFRTDNGFTTRNDYRQTSFWTGLDFSPNRSWLVEWEPSVGIGRVWDYENRFKDEWIRPNLWFNLPAQTDLWIQYLVSSERFGEDVIPGIRVLSTGGNTRFSEMLGGGWSLNTGQGIYRDFDDPQLADQLFAGAYVRLKPTTRVELTSEWDYGRMDSRRGEGNLFAGYILRNRLNVNFTREWFLRLVVQYDDFSDRLDVEPLLTYKINPFTVFYAGTTSRYQLFRPADYDEDEFPVPTRDDWKLSERQFFVKLQYLFRL
jgi:hypothetical protein